MGPGTLVQLVFFVVAVFSQQLPLCLKGFTSSSREPVDLSVSKLTCHLQNGNRLPVPPPNYRACFRTCIRRFQNGTELCEADDPTAGMSIEPLTLTYPTVPALQGMYFTTPLTSPGFLSGRQYRNSAICRYHVKCDPGQLLHYLISSFSTEGRYGPTCLDSMTFDRSAYGTTKTICGSLGDVGADVEDFNQGELFVEFNSNRIVQNSGFYVAVTCVKPQFYNQPFSFPSPPLQTFSLSKKRRALKGATPLHTSWQPKSTQSSLQVQMPTSVLGLHSTRSFRVVLVTIPIGSTMTYNLSTVRICQGDNGLYQFDGIQALEVYNRAEGYVKFCGSAGTRKFPGLAQLFIGYSTIQCVQLGVDNKFRLTINDQDALSLLYQELYRLGVFVSEDFKINDLDDPPAPSFPKPTPAHFNYTQVAYTYSQSSNGVLRAAACLYRDKVLQSPCTPPAYS